MSNFKQQTLRTQDNSWLTQNCGRVMPFADVVAVAAQRQHLLPQLALEYQARDARFAARTAARFDNEVSA